MSEETRKEHEKELGLLDVISELIYVSDIETHELLYMNAPGRNMFCLNEIQGSKCYQVLQHLEEPCSFCSTKFLEKGKPYIWEHHNEVTGGYYLLKDSLVEWKGRPARMEIAFDITSQKVESQKLENALAAERMVMSCVQQLHHQTQLTDGIYNMLRQLGEKLNAERAFIFEIANDNMSDIYEWCAPGVRAEQEILQNMDISLLERWKASFQRGECVIIQDLETIRDISPEEYRVLHSQNIHSLAAAPLEENGCLIGFFGVDNPAAEKIQNIEPLFTTLRYFLMNTMARIADEKKLTDMSFSDMLTGLSNRNCYIQDVKNLEHYSGSAGVVFIDLNGLKEINDKEGHAAGDQVLVACSQKMCLIFPEAKLYRIGGDEFIILWLNVDEAKFLARLEDFGTTVYSQQVHHLALGSCWESGCIDIVQMILNADTKMYDDKRRYYLIHEVSGRYRKFSEDENSSKEKPLLKDYNMLMSSMDVGVSKHLFKDDFLIMWANDSFYEMTEFTKSECETVYRTCLKDIFKDEKVEYLRLKRSIEDTFAAGKSGFETLVHMPQKNGTYIWVNISGTFTDEIVDKIPVFYAVFTNVNDLIQIQKEQTVTYDSLPGFVAKIQMEKKGPRILYANDRFASFFGQDKTGEFNKLMRENIFRNWKILKQNKESFSKGESVMFEISARDVEGEFLFFQVCGDCIDWISQEPVYLLVFIDITESTLQKAQLKTLAFVDPVTGGRNRTSFAMDAGNAVAEAPPRTYTLISVDIQKFKVINDLFGIEIGDSVLRYVYGKMVQILKPGEFATRISSDVFNLLFKTGKPDEPELRMQALVKNVNNSNHLMDHKYLLVFSAGIYEIEDPTLPMIQLQDRANVARKMLKNANSTQQCVCKRYSAKDSLRLAHEKDIENRMQDALKHEEFVIYLQPKQNLLTGLVEGAEALVRWADPQRGLVPPDEFIPLFERNGFIVDLDLYVFEKVCIVMKRWLEEKRSLMPISVNLSRVHLGDIDFLKKYEHIRRSYGIPPELLEIELTETLVFENPQLLSVVIEDIRRAGYRCSMDDFGSGYSSLNVLKNIRVDVLKLDKTFFTSENIDSPWEAAIISGVIELAKRLRMKTVAEGVETEGQAEFLRQAGCDMLQGYLFSKPVPVEVFEALVWN